MGMPQYVLDQIKDCLSVPTLKNRNILLVGIAYKRNIGDTRESSAVEIMKLLMKEKANLSFHDPYAPEIHLDGKTLKSVELDEENVKNSDCVILTTDHSQLPLGVILEHASFVYDTRNMTEGLSGRARIVRLGAGEVSVQKGDNLG